VKVIANAFSAGFHLITQRARPPPVGSRDLVLLTYLAIALAFSHELQAPIWPACPSCRRLEPALHLQLRAGPEVPIDGAFRGQVISSEYPHRVHGPCVWGDVGFRCGPACQGCAPDWAKLVGPVWPHDEFEQGQRWGSCRSAPSPDGPGGRVLNLADQGMIQMGRRCGLSYAEIGKAQNAVSKS
jgi:hypothetical protein